ncbi:MAG TPA: helix-turn-helix transcriptional regulator, partial [Phycisphaerae bacterium]|nr:helix-turn-helix transcriptional regulator [Phycisphaerae bacterium]
GPKAPESIETQLKRAIRQSGLSLREIARRSGIAHNTINNFIKNQSVVSIESTDKIFFALGKRIKVL